jgi:hypothetical protein
VLGRTPRGDDIDDFYGLNDVIYGGAGNDSLSGGGKSGSSSVLVGGAPTVVTVK